MDCDRWKARAKGGILRREFLSYAVRAGKWAAGISVSVWASDFLAARREQQTTAKRNIVMEAKPGHFEVRGPDTVSLRLGVSVATPSLATPCGSDCAPFFTFSSPPKIG